MIVCKTFIGKVKARGRKYDYLREQKEESRQQGLTFYTII